MKRIVTILVVLMILVTATSGIAEKQYRTRHELSDGSILCYEYDAKYDAWAEVTFDSDEDYDYLDVHVKSVDNNAVVDLHIVYEHNSHALVEYYVAVEEYYTMDNRMSWWCYGESCDDQIIADNQEFTEWITEHGMEDYEINVDGIIG